MTLAPRVVVVSRRSEWTELLERHGTAGAAGFFLRSRGRDSAELVDQHESHQRALRAVAAAIPGDWRRGQLDRDELARFVFGPEDIIVTVGPDGLVANAAKYVTTQPVIGVAVGAPGALAGFAATQVAQVLPAVAAGRAPELARTMVMARLDDGQCLYGLNDVYVGHAGHQSARYELTVPDGRSELHSSSGVVVGTPTGSTGWCASLAADRAGAAKRSAAAPTAPDATELHWYAREAWPSATTCRSITHGVLSGESELSVVSHSDQLVVFADGMEVDHLTVGWGQRLTVRVADRALRWVAP